MRGKAFFAIVLLSVSLLLCACSKESGKDLNRLTQSITESFFLTETESVETAEELQTRFLISEEDIEDFSAEYSADSDTRQELVLIKAKDKNAAYRVKTVLYNRLDSFLSNSKSYSPEEYAMLEKCNVNVYNDTYVTLVIAENAEEIDSYIEEYLS